MTVADLLVINGIILVVGGLWWLAPAAAVAVVGLALVLVGVRGNRWAQSLNTSEEFSTSTAAPVDGDEPRVTEADTDVR